MKKRILFLYLILTVFFAVACASRSEEGLPISYTVTFVQEGQADVVKTVEQGDKVELPTIIATPPVGYTYEWERTDFSALSGNITVRLKAVPNQYTIYYDIGDDSLAQIESETQTVVFDGDFSPLIPTRFGYTFTGWVVVDTSEAFAPEKYTVAGDTYLVAKWTVDVESDRWFTPDL